MFQCWQFRASGTFTLYLPERGAVPAQGTLDLRALYDKKTHPEEKEMQELHKIVSPYALMPRAHRVLRMRNLDGGVYAVSFYTEDSEGSEWSLHCKAWEKRSIYRVVRTQSSTSKAPRQAFVRFGEVRRGYVLLPKASSELKV